MPQDSTRWFVTKPRVLTVWESVFHVFRPRVWLLLLVSYATVVVLEVSFARLARLGRGLGPDLSQYGVRLMLTVDGVGGSFRPNAL